MRLVWLFEVGNISGAQLYIEGFDGLIEVGYFGGADDGGCHGSFLEEPGEGDMRATDAMVASQFGDALDDDAVDLGGAVVLELGDVVGLGAE